MVSKDVYSIEDEQVKFKTESVIDLKEIDIEEE